MSSSGNIGIGVANPLHKLDVNGKGRFAEGIIITNNGITGSIVSGFNSGSVIFISSSLVPNATSTITSSFSLGSKQNKWKELWVASINVASKTINFYDENDVNAPTKNSLSIGNPYVVYDEFFNPVTYYPIQTSGSLVVVSDFHTQNTAGDNRVGFSFDDLNSLIQVGDNSANLGVGTSVLAQYNGTGYINSPDSRITTIGGLLQTETALYYSEFSSTSSISLPSASASAYIIPSDPTTTGSFEINSTNIVITGSSPLPTNTSTTIYVTSGSTYEDTLDNIISNVNYSSSVSPFNITNYLINITSSRSGTDLILSSKIIIV
jgi:hypothetical protein